MSSSADGMYTLNALRAEASTLNVPMVALVVLPIAIWMLWRWSQCETKLSKLPYVGSKEEFRINCKALLRKGHGLYGDGWWRLDTPDGDRVVMPHRYIDELKNRPRKDLSFTKANSDILLGKYTGIDEVNEQSIEVVKFDLTKNIGSFLPDLEEETAYAFAREFGSCTAEPWNSFPVHEKSLRIVSMVSNRIFVGTEVSRKEEWIQSSIQYTGDVFMGGQQLKSWHPLLRPLMFRLLAPMRRLETMKASARRLLFPVLRAREADRAEQGNAYSPPQDTITWMQERSAHIPSFDFREQAHIQLIIGLAAIHTTGMALTHMLLDLASYPEYIEPLRDEIRKVLESDNEGGSLRPGHLSKSSLADLVLLDSFMKESQRLSPIALTFFTRKTSVPLTLSDGFHVPAGTHLTCNEEIPSDDPETWGRLDEFDGFRFARCRQKAAAATEEKGDSNASTSSSTSHLLFGTTSPQSLPFGHGRHACPGRYFAAAELKVVLCYLLMNYDIRLAGDGGEKEVESSVGKGEKKGKQSTRRKRPANIYFETAIMPDPTARIELRKRTETSGGKGEEGSLDSGDWLNW